MSRLGRRIEKCAVCGEESNQIYIISTNEMSYRDLDDRPAEMLRSTMPHWVHECPHCGYVSADLRKVPEQFEFLTPGMLESEEYKTCDNLGFESKLAERFYKLSMIEGDLAHYEIAWHAVLVAAWACDDVGDYKNAMICRSRAAFYIDWILYKNRLKKNIVGLQLIKIDLMRRSGAFDPAFNESSIMLRFDEVPAILPLFEYYLCWKRDAGAYTYKDAEEFGKKHPHKLDISDIESGMKAMKGDKAFADAEQFFDGLFLCGFNFFEDCLVDDAEYISDYQGGTVKGKKEVWDKLRAIALSRKEIMDAVPAVITWSSDEDTEHGYEKGTHCLALKYPEDKDVRSLALIKGNEDGLVTSIRIADVGEKEYILCPRPGWKGFTPRMIREERRFDRNGNLIDTKRSYLDDSPVEE